MAQPASPIYLVGPTGVGKSDLAVEVAIRLGGEIVGADAFQIYRELPILTAQPDTEARARVPHHLVGEVAGSESFDVARYVELARERMAAISARGHIAVVAGGTGLYVHALTHGLAELPPANEELRAELESRPLPELVSELQHLDPVAAARMDLKNPRRVIRALEVCRATGLPFSSFQNHRTPLEPVRGVCVTRPREVLNERIDRRCEQMLAQGATDEVRQAEHLSSTAEQAIGVRPIRALLRGECTECECRALIQQQTRQYAKRQMTWFRRETHFTTVELSDDFATDVERIVAALKA